MNISWTTFPANLLATFIAASLTFLVGLYWPIIPKSYRQCQLRRFWGKGVLGAGVVVSYGGFRDSRLFDRNPPKFRYIKQFHDGRQIEFVGPFGNVVADAEIRSASYLINTLSRYRNKPVPVEVDSEAFDNLKRTIVALGSRSSNEITDFILREPDNRFLEFRQVNEETYIYDKMTHREFRGFQPPVKKDVGMVLKVVNQRFPGNYFFVCAGLGERGTSGAAWFLANNWIDLHKEFKDGFGVVVEVELGSDESAHRIFP